MMTKEEITIGEYYVCVEDYLDIIFASDDTYLLLSTPNNEMARISPYEGLAHTISMESFLRCFIPAKKIESQVDHPSHYGGDTPYEVIKVLEAWGFDKNAYRFNAIKYLSRGDKKGNLRQDLEKAIWYIQREISTLKD